MKKIWILVLIFALLLTACSSDKEEQGNDTKGSANTEESGADDATTGDEVTIVFPVSVIGDAMENVTSEIEAAGATNITKSDDGSVVATLSQENLDKLLQKYHSEITEMSDNLQAEDNFSSIKKMEYDKDTFQTFELTVNKESYTSEESLDGLVLFGLAMQSMMYQIYSGVDEADMSVTFHMIDESTGEVFETTVLPGE